MEEWFGLIGSVLGGLIGGLFTFFGVKLTLKHEKEKSRKEILLQAYENKPRLEIIKYLNFEATANKKSINNDCNVIALNIEKVKNDGNGIKFFYDLNALENKNLVYVEYELKNTGKTEIEDICITSNLQKSMSVIEFERKDFYINENLLNYEVWSHKRYIKPGQTIKVRIYYVKEKVISSYLSYPFTIWLLDINGRYWRQNFNSPNNEIEISSYSSRAEFKNTTDVDAAIVCFNKPYLW